MNTIAEIQAAIEKLPNVLVDELARWLETSRQMRAAPPAVENWLERARGTAIPGVRTDHVMNQTRGEE